MKFTYRRFMSNQRRFLALLLLALFLSACGGSDSNPGPVVPALAVSISPKSVTLSPGASTVFTAETSGGEAIRLFVDWTIQEGATGGTLGTATENSDGTSSVTYTAPSSGSGPFHVVASIRGSPTIYAAATIN